MVLDEVYESTLLRMKPAAHMLGVHVNTLRQWADAGLIPMYRMGSLSERRFDPKDIEAFKAKQRSQQPCLMK